MAHFELLLQCMALEATAFLWPPCDVESYQRVSCDIRDGADTEGLDRFVKPEGSRLVQHQ